MKQHEVFFLQKRKNICIYKIMFVLTFMTVNYNILYKLSLELPFLRLSNSTLLYC